MADFCNFDTAMFSPTLSDRLSDLGSKPPKYLPRGTLGMRKYIEQSCLTYFLRRQFTNRDHLAAVALSDFKKVMATRWSLLLYWMRRKYLKQFGSFCLE